MRKSTKNSSSAGTRRPGSFWVALLLVVLVAIMLIVGLQPYANYKDNWVSFTDELGEMQFGKYGLAVGSLPEFVSEAARNHTLEMVVTPIINDPLDVEFHVFAQLDSPNVEASLIVGQWKNSLIAINGVDRRGSLGLPRVSSNLSEHLGEPIEVTIRFKATETVTELNGQLVKTGPAFLFNDPLTRISVGNDPSGSYGWRGGLARLEFRNSADETQKIAYRFDQNTLPAIEAETSIGLDAQWNLTVPSVGGFPDKHWISSVNLDQLLHQNLVDVVVNFLGFAPFGFLLTALLRIGKRRVHWFGALAIAVVCGFLFSFGIESVQTIIPGRSPHLHDLILNTTGAFLGSIGFLVLTGLWGLKSKLTNSNLFNSERFKSRRHKKRRHKKRRKII